MFDVRRSVLSLFSRNREVTNTTLPTFDVLVGQVIPAVLSVWPVAFASKPGGGGFGLFGLGSGVRLHSLL